jgi:hypothetical protein
LLMGTNLFVVKFTDELKKYDLQCINKVNGETIWQYTVPIDYGYNDGLGSSYNGEVQRIIGEYNKILWIAINSGILVGLDINTGEELYKITSPDNELSNYEVPIKTGYYFFGLYSTLDKDKGVFFGIAGYNHYWEIDVSNGRLPIFTLFDITDSLRNSGITYVSNIGYDMPYMGKYILVQHQRIKDFDSAVAIFNREIKQIVWCSISDLPERPYFGDIKKMELRHNKIFVLEKSGDFYIFDVTLP